MIPLILSVVLSAGALVGPKVGAAMADGGHAVQNDAGMMTVSQASDAGYPLAFVVYSEFASDGGTVPVAHFTDGGVFVLDKFPCAKRPTGVSATALGCLAHMPKPDGGFITDFGDENVMQPGFFSGAGCKPTPCAIYSGDQAP